MPETSVISRLPAAGDADLVRQLPHLTIALGENEFHAATILAFDPDAHISAGQLAGHDEDRDRLLAGEAMALAPGRCSPAPAARSRTGWMTRRAWHSSLPSVQYRLNQSSSTGSDRASVSGRASASAGTAMPAARA
jgi:hypothetical protein